MQGMSLSFTKSGPYSDPARPGRGAKQILLNVHGVRAGIVVNSNKTQMAVRASFGYFIESIGAAPDIAARSRTGTGSGTPFYADPMFALFEVLNDSSASAESGKMILRYPTGEYFESDSLATLLPLLLGIVTQNVNERQDNLCIIHSASLVTDGRGVMLIGGSGSGKTTLTLALCQNGFRFLSDEFAAIDMTSRLLRPFPRPMLPRENTMKLLGLSTDRQYSFNEPEGRRYLIDPLDRKCGIKIGKPAAVHSVFLMERGRGRPSARPAPSAKALENIAENSINASHLPKDRRLAMLDVLYHVLTRANCWTLCSSSIPETVDAVFGAMEQPTRDRQTGMEADLESIYRQARQKLEQLMAT
ncbi:MAG TPA: hypothetical protein VM163_14145 [bacterium]|nr:hypothetical protein [bacterium]